MIRTQNRGPSTSLSRLQTGVGVGVLLGVIVALLLGAVADGARSAETAAPVVQKLAGRVGPGARISLRDATGATVRKVRAGTYRIAITDASTLDNFHLLGPGVDKRTGIASRGSFTWRVIFKGGRTYTYRSDAHRTLRKTFAVIAPAPTPPPEPPLVSAQVRVTGPEEVVFDWTSDHCEPEDYPDLPAHAFRDAAGNVVLVASHWTTRLLVGPDFDHLRHDCRVAFDSHRNGDPAAFDDREWLAGLYTDDGQTVYALVHDEYHGWEHPGGCTKPWPEAFTACWYNALTLAVSRDGGRTFRHAAPPGHLIASLPFRYDPERSRGEGVGIMGDGSQIVRNPSDGYYYATFRQFPGTFAAPQWRGTCLMRTKTLDDPSSWRAWNGAGFNIRFVDPYRDDTADPEAHLCDPLFRSPYEVMGESLTWNTYLERWVMIGSIVEGPGAGAIAFTTSRDLINWETPRKIVDAEFPWTYSCGDANPIAYPSVIDPTSADRSFGTTGPYAQLYYTRNHYANCQQTVDRDLVRVPIEFSK